METQKFADTTITKAVKPNAEDWIAWINKMPPPPDTLHVRGQVVVSNPGVDVFLYKKVPQGINPTILLLKLMVVQRPGIWPQVLPQKSVAYEEVGRSLPYKTVEVFENGHL